MRTLYLNANNSIMKKFSYSVILILSLLPGIACLQSEGKEKEPENKNAEVKTTISEEKFGIELRRDSVLTPKDQLMMDWLKVIQDCSSPEKQVLPSQENNEVSTFNNALVAMAFILEGERSRAERILDFYSDATNPDNPDKDLQNFFYKGEARGFYQYMNLYDENGTLKNHQRKNSDRWMGDNVWLFFAFKHYQTSYHSDRYDKIIGLLKDLIISFYVDDPGPGGFIDHGWRHGDSILHLGFGHHEGNIDAYAMLRLIGENGLADSVRLWLDHALTGENYPLDLYTWRVLAYGKEYAYLLDIPESDIRYRKTVESNGKKAVGFFHGPDINADNIWLDGTGHMACAYITCGDKHKGFFYANQLDNFAIERKINNTLTHAIPYTFNASGGYGWVRHDRGFISVVAWYFLAKNKFNPLQLTIVE